ncbi:hypothetical protein TKK_0008697 [Trichogramma kaykai]|uniref:Pinin/SDK/MemA protein domain-containing protein n=1 Tax=Trichogramma kaykai TaxID=54128 RepID=A0ABD2X5E9_9HYME
MKESWGADNLEAQLEAARDGLRGLEKNIRKILGRDVAEGENGTVPATARLNLKRNFQDDRRRPQPDASNNEFPAKRRWQQGSKNAEPKTVFSRLSARAVSNADDSGDEDDGVTKPAVSSRVIATPREVPSRQEVIRRESTDERSKQRNRRMFGALLGTLQKFRQEETKLKAKEDKKAEIEARVEEAKQKEKEELKKERQQLFQYRKQQIAQVKALEAKVARSTAFKEWRDSQLPLLKFIKSKTKPHIYYLPRVRTPETDALILESANEIKAEIARREKILYDDLDLLQSNTDKDGDKDMHSSDHNSLNVTDEGKENRNINPDKNGSEKDNEHMKDDDKEDFREEDRYEHLEEDGEEEKDYVHISSIVTVKKSNEENNQLQIENEEINQSGDDVKKLEDSDVDMNQVDHFTKNASTCSLDLEKNKSVVETLEQNDSETQEKTIKLEEDASETVCPISGMTNNGVSVKLDPEVEIKESESMVSQDISVFKDSEEQLDYSVQDESTDRAEENVEN